MMPRILATLCLGLAALAAIAQDTADARDSAEEQSNDPAKAEASAVAAAPGHAGFKPPPGFKTKKRGEIVLYCMRDSTVGTRFKTEKCYDEAQMRDYLVAQQENKRDIERVRNTCSTGSEFCRRN